MSDIAPYTYDEIGQLMAQAMGRRTEGQVVMVNFNGAVGREAIDAIEAHADATQLAAWKGVGDGDGNCFFASTDLMRMLVDAGVSKGFRLVTGLFAHPDVPHTLHGWLEYRKPDGAVAVNCSNLAARPLYAMERGQYYDLNNCAGRIQSIDGDEFSKRWKAVRRKFDDEPESTRHLTKALLRKTLLRQT